MIRGMKHLPCEDRVGIFQPGEEKVPGRPHSTFQYLKAATQELERVCRHVVIGQEVMALN